MQIFCVYRLDTDAITSRGDIYRVTAREIEVGIEVGVDYIRNCVEMPVHTIYHA